MCPYQRLFAASDAEQRKISRTQGVAGPVISTSGRAEEQVSSHSSSVQRAGVMFGWDDKASISAYVNMCWTSSTLQMTRKILRWSTPERPNWTRFLLETSVRFRCFKKSRRRCGRGRHGRPWPCEWDVGREPDRDERSEPPAATPPPDELNRWEHVKP